MKTLTDKIQESLNEQVVNEARQVSYQVCIDEFALSSKYLDEDSDYFGAGVTIFVDKEIAKAFEKFLLDQEGNMFSHACSNDNNNIEY